MNNSPQKFIITNIIKQSPESESLGDCSFCPLTSPPMTLNMRGYRERRREKANLCHKHP